MNTHDEIILRPTMRFALVKALPSICLAVAFVVLAWHLSPYFLLFSLPACGIAWYKILYIRTITYQIASEYIRTTKGIFFKRTDQVEMYRIKDYVVTQPLLLQMFGLMHLTLMSTETVDQEIRLQGIPVTELVDVIRQRVQNARSHNQMLELN